MFLRIVAPVVGNFPNETIIRRNDGSVVSVDPAARYGSYKSVKLSIQRNRAIYIREGISGVCRPIFHPEVVVQWP